MPNWCENRMMVFGDKDKLEKFFNDCDKDSNHTFDWRKLLLSGSEFDVSHKQWETAMWRTGDVEMGEIEECNGTYQLWIDYETAWEPALIGLSKLSAKYQLRFELNYFEPGYLFGGKYCVDNGIQQCYLKYQSDEAEKFARENGFRLFKDEELEDSEVEKGIDIMSDNVESAKIIHGDVFVVYDHNGQGEVGAFFDKDDAERYVLEEFGTTLEDMEEEGDMEIMFHTNGMIVELADGKKYLLGSEIK